MNLPIQKKPCICTKRLTLRPYAPEDTAQLVALLTHPEVTKTFMVPDFATPEQAVRAVLAELRDMGFRRVTAGYFEGNEASHRVMEKCGMQPIAYTDEEEYRGVRHLCRYCEVRF